MNPDVAAWLIWLVGQQSVQIGAPDAPQAAQMAFRALEELGKFVETEQNSEDVT